MIPSITPPEVADRLAAGDGVLFLDARSREAHARSRHQIPRSVRVAPDEVDAFVTDLPRGATFVVYCSSPSEGSSARVTRRLRELGFARAFALVGGFEGWEAARYPVEPIPRCDPAQNSAQHQAL